MSLSPSYKAIALGSLVVFGGYALCMLLVGTLTSIAAPRLAWFVLAVVAVLLATSSGFVGALFARSAPLFNGALAGFVGSGVLLLGLAVIAPAGMGIVLAGHFSPLHFSHFLALSSRFTYGHVAGSNSSFQRTRCARR